MLKEELEKLPSGQIIERVPELARIADQALTDLEKALNMVRQYQRIVAMGNLNDPCLVEARNLLRKYKMDYKEPDTTGQIFVDGQDITIHPDSIQGEAFEMELEAGRDEPAQITDAYVIEDDDGDPC